MILFHRQAHGIPRRYDKDETDESINNRGGDHYDWMFQADGCLATWATAELLRTDCADEVGAIVLPDHRVDYLQFEGDVSDDRGSVRRVESGQFELIAAAPDRLEVRTRGNRNCVLVIYRTWCGEGVSFWRISSRPSADGMPTRADAS
ncbi:MAG TPA: hypothetical protein DDZ51_23920 [Planctomycetaceae bacterium]|nr:hypothetical protein [Planctomycetaceae bacterium]